MNALNAAISRADLALKQIRDAGIAPSDRKQLARRFSATEVANLVGRSPSYVLSTLAKLEAEEKCPPFSEEGRYKYQMEHVKILREIFDTAPYRDPEIDEPVVLAVQNFKGGVGKTTVSLNLAQHLVIQGYRVLLIDMDSQASATASFGYLPDEDLDEGDTLIPFFEQDEDDIRYCIRNTYWPGLDLVPSNLTAFSVEWSMAQAIFVRNTPEEREYWTTRLKSAVDSVADDYDVVIIDSPPSLGTTSMNILRAVNALLVPTPAKMLDFSSTVQYLHMLDRMVEGMPEDSVNLHFVSLVTTLYEGRDNAPRRDRAESDEPVMPNMQMQFRMLMEELFEDEGMLIDPPFKKIAEIENAASSLGTVLEERRPQKAASEMLHLFNAHIELQILRCWPSKVKAALEMEKDLRSQMEKQRGS